MCCVGLAAWSVSGELAERIKPHTLNFVLIVYWGKGRHQGRMDNWDITDRQAPYHT